MQVNLIQKVADELVSNNIIDSESRDLYTYGLQQGVLIILNILTIIVIGKIFGMIWQSVVFMIAYIPIRTYAGGYHARTQLRCYISSVVLIVTVLLGIKFIPWTNFVCVMTAIISGLIIYILSPVEDINKPLDAAEVKVYGKNARIILALELGILIMLMILGVKSIAVCISISLFVLSIMLILGEIKNKQGA